VTTRICNTEIGDWRRSSSVGGFTVASGRRRS